MRPTLVEALSYPRDFVRSNMELERCAYDGAYNDEDRKCRGCPQRPECEWLYSSEEFAALVQEPIAEILAALEIAADYVSSQIAHAEHDSRQCGCTPCTWIRDALRLVDRARTP